MTTTRSPAGQDRQNRQDPPADQLAGPDPERLTSAPEPVEVPRPGQRRLPLLLLAWRQLTSMRTALLLLFLLALAAVPGGFLPQRPTSPQRVVAYLARHPTVGPLLDRLQLFDVFASTWFSAAYLLLFVSLVGCLWPRLRIHARALRSAPPRTPARLDRLPASAGWTSTATPEAALGAARRHLRRRFWRVTVRQGAVSAEKGYLRETGNLLFHVSLVVLLIGIAVGGFLGFKGTVLVKEHQGFANTIFSYDDVKPGRRFDPAHLVPFNFTLNDFRATYGASGEALTFDADLVWRTGPTGTWHRRDLQVNHPLAISGTKVYLIGHGYAPRVVVHDPSGAVAFDEAVACLPQDVRFLSACTIKVPDALGADGRPTQFGFEGVFTPTTVQDPKTGRVGSAHPGLNDPALTLLGYQGDLGVDAGVPRSVYSLDKQGLRLLDPNAQALRVGDTWQMPGGGSVTLDGVDEWATFQVTQDPGKGLALVASIGIVAGLLLSLFVRRRRIWIRVLPADQPGQSRVEVGGLSRTDPDTFVREFQRLCEELEAVAAPIAPAADGESQPADSPRDADAPAAR